MDKLRAVATVVATALWVASALLMVVATVLDADPALAHWSLLVGLWATVITGWVIIDHQRYRVETIARLLDREREPEGLRLTPSR